jgi:hypothetical protein
MSWPSIGSQSAANRYVGISGLFIFYFLYNMSSGRIVYFRRTPDAQSSCGITDSI